MAPPPVSRSACAACVPLHLAALLVQFLVQQSLRSWVINVLSGLTHMQMCVLLSLPLSRGICDPVGRPRRIGWLDIPALQYVTR